MQGTAKKVFYVPGNGDDSILRPNLVVVNGRAYRKLGGAPVKPTSDETYTPQPPTPQDVRYASQDVRHPTRDKYNRQEREEEEEANEELEDSIEKTARGYRASLKIPSVFFKYIIGKGGQTRANIERETRCKITVPSRSATGDIVLEASTLGALKTAKRRIEIVAWSNRAREPPTHFICIPLNTPPVMSRVQAFREVVLRECGNDQGVEPTVFQAPCKMHLTLAVLRMYTPNEEARAASVLEECLKIASQEVGSATLAIRLQGIDCMNDDPSAVKVLYAKVTEVGGSDRLQRFVDALQNAYLKRAPDLIKNEPRDSVKLHATVMNTSFKMGAAAEQAGKLERARRTATFDATKLFAKFREFDFDQLDVTGVKLCRRGEYGQDGFYVSLADYPLDRIGTEK